MAKCLNPNEALMCTQVRWKHVLIKSPFKTVQTNLAAIIITKILIFKNESNITHGLLSSTIKDTYQRRGYGDSNGPICTNKLVKVRVLL